MADTTTQLTQMVQDNQIYGVALIALGIYLYNYYRTTTNTQYKDDGSYDNMTPLKHDLFKTAITELFPLLFFPLAAGQFYNQDDLLNSFVGRLVVSLFSFFVYYVVFEPNVFNKLRKF